MADTFGPLISDETVQDAVLALLSLPPTDDNGDPAGGSPLLVYYLAEIERQVGLIQQTLEPPLVYRGGTDFEVYQGDQSPTVVVVVKPTGAPERFEAGSYGQRFEIQAGVILQGSDQDDGRLRARYYGLAMAAVIAQNADLGPNPYDSSLKLASETHMTAFPVAEFAADENTSRQIMRSVVSFETLVMPVVVSWAGPESFPTSPYTVPSPWPTVSEVDVTVTDEPLD
jgi:hypothetical protein